MYIKALVQSSVLYLHKMFSVNVNFFCNTVLYLFVLKTEKNIQKYFFFIFTQQQTGITFLLDIRICINIAYVSCVFTPINNFMATTTTVKTLECMKIRLFVQVTHFLKTKEKHTYWFYFVFIAFKISAIFFQYKGNKVLINSLFSKRKECVKS